MGGKEKREGDGGPLKKLPDRLCSEGAVLKFLSRKEKRREDGSPLKKLLDLLCNEGQCEDFCLGRRREEMEKLLDCLCGEGQCEDSCLGRRKGWRRWKPLGESTTSPLK